MKDFLFKSFVWFVATTPFMVSADEIQPPAASESDGVIGGYEYVDLGLPSGTLWATYNIGANEPCETGSFFAWGEVEPRDDFSWESYEFFIGYDGDPEIGYWVELENIGENICGTKYDAARHLWGSGWRLPNSAESYELRMLCWSKIAYENGVPGLRVYGPNEHSIFLPGKGIGLWNGERDPFNDCCYWVGEEEKNFNSSPIDPGMWAKNLMVQQYSSNLQCGQTTKAYGICIRPVINLKESGLDDAALGDVTAIVYRDGYIYVSGDSLSGELKVCDLSGRAVYTSSVMDGRCSLTDLSAGIYVVSFIQKGTRVATQKIAVR